jgi:hypothetical protein
METLILYSLSVYWLYHILSRADILKRPRAWAQRVLPSWLSYPLTCAFCFTWWVGVVSTLVVMVWAGVIVFSPIHLFAAPVVCYVLDLVVQGLIRYNTPPVFTISNKVPLALHNDGVYTPFNPINHEQMK